MARKRCIVVYVALSADGYIARPDGGVEWLDRPRTAGDYGMRAFLRSVDTILWGRKTYEVALGFGEKGTDFGPRIRNFVFTRGSLRTVAPGFEVVRQPIAGFVERLREEPGRDAWVMGGSELIGSLLDAGEVDALVLHVIPTLIGAGIPLLAPRHRLVPLRLKSVKPFADGVIRLHYLVERGPAAPGPQLPAAEPSPAPAAGRATGRGRSRRRPHAPAERAAGEAQPPANGERTTPRSRRARLSGKH